MKNYAIILASGSGNRFGGDRPKQFANIGGKTMIERTIEIFEKALDIDSIIIVINPDYRADLEEIINKNKYKKIANIVNGGAIRKESSFIGVNSIMDNEANVIIHDCARPLLSQRIIKDCIDALKEYKAVGVVVPATDTIVKVRDNIIEMIPNRETLACIQTPQCFKLSIIKKAHELSKNDSNFTDDCGLVVKHNLADIYVVKGDFANIKITYPEDIYIAEQLLKS